MNLARLFRLITLLPFSVLWAFVTQLRNALYQVRVLKSISFPIKTIVVGNLSTGGTGKSPHAEFIARMSDKNCKTAILSRGYLRKTKGFILSSEKDTPQTIGDEPFMLKKRNPHISIAVCENRVEGVRKLIEEQKIECVVLDDAFQHRMLKAEKYVLLTRFDRPFFSDAILPSGDLREMPVNAIRADIIIVTKAKENISKEIKNSYRKIIQRYNKKAPILFSWYKYDDFVYSEKSKIRIEHLKNTNILLITAIANPSDIVSFLKTKALNVSSIEFSDHKRYSKKECHKIQNRFEKMEKDKSIIITTEKDYVKLKDILPQSIPVYCLPIQVQFQEEDRLILESSIFK